jgi:hypothetical protein
MTSRKLFTIKNLVSKQSRGLLLLTLQRTILFHPEILDFVFVIVEVFDIQITLFSFRTNCLNVA